MEFIARAGGRPQTVGILPGSFNPPTVAHLELAYAAGFHVDEVVCVVPRVFPHKKYFGATMEQRLEMLRKIETASPLSIAVTDRGMFIDIAREVRRAFGKRTKLFFLCGADAAERIMTWDYGHPGFVDKMLGEFELLVAPRGAEYVAPEKHRDRIHPLHIRGNHHSVSSTEVRNKVRSGEEWRHLVPPEIREDVARIYAPGQ